MARSATAARPDVLEQREPRPRRTYTIRVLERALQVLSFFSHSRPELRLADFAPLGLHKSTLYRLLEVMRAQRLVELDPGRGEVWHRLGVLRAEQGDAAGAQAALERAAALPAPDEDVWLRLAAIYEGQDRVACMK